MSAPAYFQSAPEAQCRHLGHLGPRRRRRESRVSSRAGTSEAAPRLRRNGDRSSDRDRHVLHDVLLDRRDGSCDAAHRRRYSFSRAALDRGWIHHRAGRVDRVRDDNAVVVYFSAYYATARSTRSFGFQLPSPVLWIILYAIFVVVNWAAPLSDSASRSSSRSSRWLS